MFCGKCGKEMPNGIRFCPHCGAECRTAGAAADRRPAAPAPAAPAAGKSLYHIALIVLGALQAAMFLLLPYGKLKGMAAFLILGTKAPDGLTGLNAIRVMKACANLNIANAEEAYLSALIVFGLPLAAGILTAVLHLLNNTKKGYTISIVLSVVTLVLYISIKGVLEAYVDLGYTMGAGRIFAILVTIVQLAVSVQGRRRDRTAAA